VDAAPIILCLGSVAVGALQRRCHLGGMRDHLSAGMASDATRGGVRRVGRRQSLCLIRMTPFALWSRLLRASGR
jgi:hypothetical protein